MSNFAFRAFAVCLIGLALFPASVFGMPMPLQVKPGKPSVLTQTTASIIGGESGEPLSLLSVKSEPGIESATGRSEKVILVFGDRSGKPLVREPGFFQISVGANKRSVIIDLAQVNQTAVDPRKLARLLASSKIVENSEITMDPHDQSTNITLNTKAPVNVKVASENSGGSRIVIELISAKGRAR